MRILFLLLFTFFIAQPFTSNAQDKKEMQEQMLQEIKDVKDQIAGMEKDIAAAKANKADAESIKEMEDELIQAKKQLVLLENTLKSLGKMPNSVIQQVEKENNDDGDNDIPKLDKDRIKQLPDGILSDAELVPFVKNIKNEVEKKLPAADKTKAEELYNMIKGRYSSPTALGNIASACKLNGYTEMALYLMGKVCISDISNGNNLNNYAAFLTMSGGEHLALPILENLNNKFPGNSTILNNIGQAWFGLGEMNDAKKYLNMAIAAHPTHSQANQTISKIYKSEGKTAEAVQAMKNSIAENYNGEKEAVVTELGGKLENDDVPWKYPKPFEPFGLEKFLQAMPAYPMSLDDAEQRNAEWQYFHQQLNAAAEKLEKEIEELKKKKEAFEEKLLDIPNQYTLLKPYKNVVWATANRKLLLLAEWGLDKHLRISKKMDDARHAIEKMREKYRADIEKAGSNTGGATCAELNSILMAYMAPANLIWHDVQLEKIRFEKQYLGEEISYLSYANIDDSYFELEKAQFKRGFVTLLISLNYEYEKPCIEPKNSEGKRGELPDFDDVNCQYKSTLYIPPFTTITIECNKMTTEFRIEPEFDYGPKVSPYIKLSFTENLTNNTTIIPSNITKATVEVGASSGTGNHDHEGPLKGEVKVEAGVGIEVTEHGVEEVYVKAGVKAEVGSTDHVTATATPAGIETEVSWNAGEKGSSGTIKGTLEGKGLLSGIHIAGPK